jgi:S-adenosyl methyltransferase
MTADDPLDPLARLDASVPHPARRYDYWLGGKDNFAADRESGDQIAKRWPHIVTAARENRAFLQRAVDYCARHHGIRQFLDIGTGLPTADNTHEVAQRVDPASRIVYVDNDPLVLVHARALLTSTAEGKTAYLDADLRDPHTILKEVIEGGIVDLSQPVALLLVAVLHFLPDAADPYGIVTILKDALAPGSLLVLSHGSYDLVPVENVRQLTGDRYPGDNQFHARTRAQVTQFSAGFDLVEPGPDGTQRQRPEVAVVSEWGRPAGGQRPPPHEVSMFGGVARKPAAGGGPP